MRIRNCFLALSLVSVLPFQLMAADDSIQPVNRSATGMRQSQKGQQCQQAPATTEDSKCKRIGKWVICSLWDAAATATAAVQYDRIDNTFDPEAAGDGYLTRIGRAGRACTITTLALGSTALVADAVGVYAVLTDDPCLEQRACRAGAVCRAGAFGASLAGNAGFWHTDRTYSPQTPALAGAIDEVEEWGAGPLIGFGLPTIKAAYDIMTGRCSKPAPACKPVVKCDKGGKGSHATDLEMGAGTDEQFDKVEKGSLHHTGETSSTSV